jgi:hypothetical protein
MPGRIFRSGELPAGKTPDGLPAILRPADHASCNSAKYVRLRKMIQVDVWYGGGGNFVALPVAGAFAPGTPVLLLIGAALLLPVTDLYAARSCRVIRGQVGAHSGHHSSHRTPRDGDNR